MEGTMTTHPDTPQANIALVRDGVEALNAGDFGACVALLSPGLVMNLAGMPPMKGKDVWLQGAQMMRQAFPDFHVHIDDILATNDRVAVRLIIRGTHRGDYLGIPPTGRTVEYVSHEFYRIADGLFAEEWICSDMTTLHGQLTAGSESEDNLRVSRTWC
jgi:steroid delta-isomerase-like uncharacterized protein